MWLLDSDGAYLQPVNKDYSIQHKICYKKIIVKNYLQGGAQDPYSRTKLYTLSTDKDIE